MDGFEEKMHGTLTHFSKAIQGIEKSVQRPKLCEDLGEVVDISGGRKGVYNRNPVNPEDFYIYGDPLYDKKCVYNGKMLTMNNCAQGKYPAWKCLLEKKTRRRMRKVLRVMLIKTSVLFQKIITNLLECQKS